MKLNSSRGISTLHQWSLLLFTALAFVLPAQGQGNKPLNIKSDYLLVINAYTSDAPWSNALIEPVQKWVSAEQGVALFVEHLNMLMISDTVQFDKVKRAILNKYSDKAPKAVMLLGNPSLLLKDDIRALWGDPPVILCAEEDYFGPDSVYIEKLPIPEGERVPLSTLADRYNMTVLQTKMFPKDDIELLKRMVPGVKKVLLIGDGRYINQQLNYDMERLMARIIYETANAKELRALSAAINSLPQIKASLSDFNSALLKEINGSIDLLDDVLSLIDNSVCEDPPFSVREGGMIKDGFNAELDSLRDIVVNGKGYIAKVQSDEQERTGIKKLKIGYNRVFGYYIEVPNAFKELVPEEYIRKQTLANCERYITGELKELESRVLGAQERIVKLEYEIFTTVRKKVADEYHRIQKTASALAALDVLCSFAYVSSHNGYTCPEMTDKPVISIKDGRHPVVEKMLRDSPFVPNDTVLDCADNRCAIITGPNMAGKSTYMRQVALIVLMAQCGCFVPASYAEIGVVDSIFTRVGASDDLASGQSTFMVEMNEVANILKNATSKSLLIFDEIGRGTSTFDGMSIARAVLEHTADKKKLGAKTLFATHYHELTELEDKLDGVKNYNIAVKKRGDDITFLRRIVRGGADGSYGIEVAKLAGVPNSVVNRARTILKELEGTGVQVHMGEAPKAEDDAQEEVQISFSSSAKDELIEELKQTDVNTLTPIEAMQKLYEIASRAKNM